jgi:hypothetical protein
MNGLRDSYLRARSLGFQEQLHECVDQLQNPELFAIELVEAYQEIAEQLPALESPGKRSAPADEGAGEPDREGFFYPSRDIFVVRDSSSFTCLARDVASWPEPSDADPSVDAADGFDYAAITCTASPRPLLGVVQGKTDGSAYPLLLRGLAGLCEIAHIPQLERLDRSCFRGLLGSVPRIDLHLVLHDAWTDANAAPERTPISQLTHDLAELAKSSLEATPRFPPVLGDIVCLHMNPERFDGRVRFDWRI